jgi:hypothetical protein
MMNAPNATPCIVCGKPDPDRGLLCLHCLNRVDGDLDAILTLTALAFAYLPAKAAPGGEARGKPGSRPPIDLDQIDAQLAHDALPLLESWERLVRESFGLSPYGPASLARSGRPADPVPATLSGCVAFLRSWLARLADTRDFPIDDMAREVAHLRRRLGRFDPDRGPAPWRVPCPAPSGDGDGRSCGWRLQLDRDDLRAVTVCPACGSQWTADRLLLVALDDRDNPVWLTAEQVADMTGVSARTLNRWADMGRIPRKGTRLDAGAALRHRRDGVASG